MRSGPFPRYSTDLGTRLKQSCRAIAGIRLPNGFQPACFRQTGLWGEHLYRLLWQYGHSLSSRAWSPTRRRLQGLQVRRVYSLLVRGGKSPFPITSPIYYHVIL